LRAVFSCLFFSSSNFQKKKQQNLQACGTIF
jgi:hypothetical protein